MIIKSIIALVGLLILALAAFIYLPGGKSRLEGLLKIGDIEPIDFSTLVRPKKPNNALICPENTCANADDIKAPVIALPAEELGKILDGLFAEGRDLTLIHRSEDGLYRDYVERTDLMRFPDVVSMKVIPINDNETTIALYSRSIYGYSDRGVNLRRMKSWIEKIVNAGRS